MCLKHFNHYVNNQNMFSFMFSDYSKLKYVLCTNNISLSDS